MGRGVRVASERHLQKWEYEAGVRAHSRDSEDRPRIREFFGRMRWNNHTMVRADTGEMNLRDVRVDAGDGNENNEGRVPRQGEVYAKGGERTYPVGRTPKEVEPA